MTDNVAEVFQDSAAMVICLILPNADRNQQQSAATDAALVKLVGSGVRCTGRQVRRFCCR